MATGEMAIKRSVIRRIGMMISMALLAAVLILLAGCLTNIPDKDNSNNDYEDDSPRINETLRCFSDAECVPDSCCHARGGVNVNYGPSCEGVMCTLSCESGTLDCGGGEVKCVSQMCTVVLSQTADS